LSWHNATIIQLGTVTDATQLAFGRKRAFAASLLGGARDDADGAVPAGRRPLVVLNGQVAAPAATERPDRTPAVIAVFFVVVVLLR
jgi:hypothetical protein